MPEDEEFEAFEFEAKDDKQAIKIAKRILERLSEEEDKHANSNG